MKKQSIIIVLITIIIILCIYILFFSKAEKRGLIDPIITGKEVEQLNQEAIYELEAEDFLERFGTEEMDEAITLEEFNVALSAAPSFEGLDSEKKCRIVKRWLRRQKCKPKRKVYKDVVNKTKIGSIGFEDGKIAINAPQIARFREETNRINILMELFYNLRSSNCDSSGFCYTNVLLMACGLGGSPAIDDAYKRCAKLFTGELQNDFVQILKLFFANIEKFNDGEITEEQVKQVMEAELDNLEQEISGAEEENEEGEEGEEDEESGEGEAQADSISANPN